MKGALGILLVVLVTVAVVTRERDEFGLRAGPAEAAPAGEQRFRGRGAAWWAREVRREHRRVVSLRRQLARRHRASSVRALQLAAVAYGVDAATLVRIAHCETGGTFSPFAANPVSSARGLLQFLTRGVAVAPDGTGNQRGTWGTTPFWRFPWSDPYASALAGAWMIREGRLREWECA